MVSYMGVLLYGVGGIVVAGMALLVAFQEKLVYVPVLPGLTKAYPITPARLRLRLLYEDVWLRSQDGRWDHVHFSTSYWICSSRWSTSEVVAEEGGFGEGVVGGWEWEGVGEGVVEGLVEEKLQHPWEAFGA